MSISLAKKLEVVITQQVMVTIRLQVMVITTRGAIKQLVKVIVQLAMFSLLKA